MSGCFGRVFTRGQSHRPHAHRDGHAGCPRTPPAVLALARHVGRDPDYVLIGASVAIINEWIATRGEIGDVEAWMRANLAHGAYNACAIVKGVEIKYIRFGFLCRTEIRTVGREDW